jgi:hypothetical protein
MTLLLVLSDEAEVGRDSQRLRYRARFCHLEAKTEGKGEGVDQGPWFCTCLGSMISRTDRLKNVNSIPIYQKYFFRKIHYPTRNPIRRGFWSAAHDLGADHLAKLFHPTRHMCYSLLTAVTSQYRHSTKLHHNKS